ncbi:MAG: two-component system response regulator KdpE [Gammaproteobacteria bacterium]
MSESTPTIVVIEDDKHIRRFLRAALEAEAMTVHEAETGQRGLIDVATRKPDLLILDLGLPDMDGVEVISAVRGWSDIPIIVLSARTQEAEKVGALDAGADDYLVKPFGVAELLARIRAHLRRTLASSQAEGYEFRFGEVKVELVERRVSRAGVPVHLTPIEYRLLATLIRSAGKVLTHRQLLKDVWGPAHVESSHYLRIYMAHLRQKLEEDPAQPHHILTEIGVGYRLVQ